MARRTERRPCEYPDCAYIQTTIKLRGKTYIYRFCDKHKLIRNRPDPAFQKITREVIPSAVRFWLKVKKGPGCWIWTGCKNTNGYGLFFDGQKKISSHRFAYKISRRRSAPNLVLHSCDTRLCVRPNHLFDGSHRDNSLDMMLKNRGAAKLHTSDIPIIRRRLAHGDAQKDIARDFGVARRTISAIGNGTSWGWYH